MLTGLTNDDDSSDNSDHELNESARSGCLGCVIIFRNLPIFGEDHPTVSGKSTAQHGDNREGTAYCRVGNMMGYKQCRPSPLSEVVLCVPCGIGVMRHHFY